MREYGGGGGVEDINVPYGFTSLLCPLITNIFVIWTQATSRHPAKKSPRRNTPRLVRSVQRSARRLSAPARPRPRALPASPGGTTWPLRAPALPAVPARRARPGRGRARTAPAPPGHPPGPAAGQGRHGGGERASKRGRRAEKVEEAPFGGRRQGSPRPAPIQTKEAPSPAGHRRSRRPTHFAGPRWGGFRP